GGVVGAKEKPRPPRGGGGGARERGPQLPKDASIAGHGNVLTPVGHGRLRSARREHQGKCLGLPPGLRPCPRAIGLRSAKAKSGDENAPSRPLPPPRRHSGRAAALQR